MVRREGPPLNGARYIGNIDTNQVHDLDNEKDECHIDEMLTGPRENTVPFESLEEAHREGFRNCGWCLGHD